MLICGDSLFVLKGMKANFVDCVITSPPYPGVDSMWGDLFSPDKFYQAHEFLWNVWDECLRVLKPGCKLIINIANTKRRPYLPNTYGIYKWALEKTKGLAEPIGEIIWYKGYAQNGTAWGSYLSPADPALADQHEYILVFRKQGKRNKPDMDYKLDRDFFLKIRNSLWQISPESAKKIGHIAPFPVELPERLIKFYTYPGEIVLDPFAGSGTTCIAAKKLGRKFIGIEKEFKYILLAKRRLSNFAYMEEML